MAERFVQSHIRSLPLFEQLSPPQIGVVAGIVQVARFEPGQLVFAEGQPTQGMFLFVSGRGILTRRAPTGAEETFGAVEAGQYIDEEALYAEGYESLTLHVVETAIVLLIPRAPFVQLLATYPEIRANVRVKSSGGSAEARETAIKLFKGQRPDETVLQVWRRHWWAVAKHSWIALVLLVVLFVAALLLAGQAPALALGAAGLAVVVPGIILAYLYYDWQDDSVVLTDQRVVRIWHRAISFETTISEMPLDQVLEVSITVPPGDPFARLFQYGTVIVRTAGEGVNMVLDTMPHAAGVQTLIFTQRDRYKEKIEQRQRDAVRNDIQQALGMSAPKPSQPQGGWREREENVGLPLLRTKFIAANGDLIYRKHSSVWIQHVFLPTLVIFGALVFMTLVLFIPNFPLEGGVGLGVGMMGLIVGALWMYFADWDWRNDLFIISSETITIIRKRPFWMQNEIERVRIAQIDNVKSEVHGLINNLLNRGNVLISLIGADARGAKVMDMIYDPQEVQAEISRRNAAIRSERQQGDIEQQRQVIKEYLQTYHEIQQTQESTRVVPQPAPPQATMFPAAPQPTQPNVPPNTVPNAPPAQDAPPLPRDGIRPPRVPRSRSD